ncbi:MAG: fumarylacetoacetate hydrolase family protein [Gemmatales bacterium]|nr:fumarylacetoacetate hydrolase family protein [Gemmatales bacterium]MDW8174978.1 fumarylacetoacetate hydrolase family protein [Gemmatales bacterium]
MRIVTLQTESGLRAGLEWNGRYLDIATNLSHLPSSVRELLRLGEVVHAQLQQLPERIEKPIYERGPIRLAAPIPDPPKVICVGLNYKDHAAESGAAIPAEPVLFSKFSSAVIGPEEPIRLPKVSKEVDYEAELVIVIGKRGRYIAEQEARPYIAGYTIGHDVSARDWQLRKPGGQWLAGKTFDTFAPIGPALVTRDEIPDPHQLHIELRLNGQVMQRSNTNQMIFSVDKLVSYISQVVTLEPGDLIFTGTPPGVGFARKPPVFLKPGDVVEIEIERIGILRNPVMAED